MARRLELRANDAAFSPERPGGLHRSPVRLGGWVLALWVLLGALGGIQAETRSPEQHFFDQTFGDFREELANARTKGKKGILIMFEMDECPFCHRMKTTVLNRPEVQDFFRANFLIFPLDIEGDVEVTDFHGQVVRQKDLALKEFRVRATPVFAFFDLEGNLIARYTGATKNADEFLWLGEYVATGAYKDRDFARFKQDKLKASAKS
jgi:thioredoxin-related protein